MYKYIFWNDSEIDKFINEHYPQYINSYKKFKYDIQRWDVIRYLILYKIGGVYVDVDYQSLKNISVLIEGRKCCFSCEEEIIQNDKVNFYFNNALIASVPNHSFMKKIITNVFENNVGKFNGLSKVDCVLKSTGPLMLNFLYENLSEREKADVYIIPTRFVSPISVKQAGLLRNRQISINDISEYLKEAYAIHYYCGSWMYYEKNTK